METFDGLLVLDKPGGITSRDAVDRAQRWFPRQIRVGHTGTLDPLATGVLVLCLGNATRLAQYVQDMRKTYRSIFRLGAASDSDDADGVITEVGEASVPSRAEVEAALTGFVGTIEQVPPAFSAAKVAGQRAYAKARRGEQVTLPPRSVTIYRVDVSSYEYPEVEVEVHCGKGTYIRSLARDLGRKLGCGGYVQTLRRISVGPFSTDNAVSLEIDREQARRHLLPTAAALSELPRFVLPTHQAEALRHGQRVPLPPSGEPPSGDVAVFTEAGFVVAVVEVIGGEVRPVKVLN